MPKTKFQSAVFTANWFTQWIQLALRNSCSQHKKISTAKDVFDDLWTVLTSHLRNSIFQVFRRDVLQHKLRLRMHETESG